MIHQAYHVLILLAFLVAVGAGFVGIVGPILFPQRKDLRLPAVKVGVGLLALSALSLVLERFVHTLLGLPPR